MNNRRSPHIDERQRLALARYRACCEMRFLPRTPFGGVGLAKSPAPVAAITDHPSHSQLAVSRSISNDKLGALLAATCVRIRSPISATAHQTSCPPVDSLEIADLHRT